MNQKRCTPLILLISAALIFGAAYPTIASQWKITHDDEWCEPCSDDGEYCEVREMIVPARTGTLKPGRAAKHAKLLHRSKLSPAITKFMQTGQNSAKTENGRYRTV
jgi:hypothetical protein